MKNRKTLNDNIFIKSGPSRAKTRIAKAEVHLAQGHSPSQEMVEDATAMSYFLRHYRGRADLAAIVNAAPSDSDHVAQLEQVRSQLALGDLTAAEICLAQFSGEDADGEVGIESLRLRLFQGRVAEALEHSELVLKAPQIQPMTLMTCYQLRGHCFILQENFERAEEELRRALILAEIYPQAKAATSAAAFQVLAQLGLRKFAEAQQSLQKLLGQVATISQNELFVDRLLIAMRTEVHFYRKTQEVENSFENLSGNLYGKLTESLALARWLQDQTVVAKCERELTDLQSAAGDLVLQNSRHFVLEFEKWILFPKQKLILEKAPKNIFRYKEPGLLDRVLNELVNSPLPVEEFFEKIWGLKYSPDRHESHLRASLSNLRKQLPSACLVVKNQIVSLV